MENLLRAINIKISFWTLKGNHSCIRKVKGRYVMRNVMKYAILFLSTLLCATILTAAEEGLVAWWKFDEVKVERRRIEMVRGRDFCAPRGAFLCSRECLGRPV